MNEREKKANFIIFVVSKRYGPDFTKSLKSFRLSEDYYDRIKIPLDIPEIRERMMNGDYDEHFLNFERDVLLMLTNALVNYDREHDIHGHARYMIDYAMELFTVKMFFFQNKQINNDFFFF